MLFRSNTEYFTSIMHLMRSDGSYRRIVDDLIEVGKDADIRHLEAVKRLTTGFLKLLFPHVQSVDDVDRDEFKKYCLDPAIHMRTIIWKQLCFMDREYRKTSMPELHVKE